VGGHIRQILSKKEAAARGWRSEEP
jgi:hypothetical protein